MKKVIVKSSVYDTFIRMLFLSFIIVACLAIMYPFINIILWTLILTLAMYPFHIKLALRLNGKKKLASVIIIISILVIVIIPTWILIGSLIEEIKVLKVSYDNGTLVIPPPDESVKDWPIIGSKLFEVWQMAFSQFDTLIIKYQDQLITVSGKVGKEILNGASSVIQIMISLFLAGVLLTIKNARENILLFFKKVGGKKGDELATITIKTVGSVVKGVLGESFVMALLNGAVFLIAGVPYSGIWTLIAFILAVLQLPILIVTIPIMIYFFVVKSLVAAIVWTIILILVSLSDNILTPIMLGKGAPVPMVVIFVGVIGGFIFSGFIGLFTGAILMSIGYSLFIEWLHSDNSDSISDDIEIKDY